MKTTQAAQHDSRSAAKPDDNSRSDDVLLRRYRQRPTVTLRNELIERHRKSVEGVARTLSTRLPRSVDVQDLVHAGIWGLMQAIENYDSKRGIPFGPFMRRRVRGAMLDELRNLDYLPRLYRQQQRASDEAVIALRARLRRDPNDAELAAELGVSEARLRLVNASVRSHENANAQNPGSRGVPQGGIDALVDESIDPLEALDRQDMLAKIESSLEPIEWKVLKLHYLEGVPGKEIARRLKLSASRICQIHGRVLSRLKLRLRG